MAAPKKVDYERIEPDWRAGIKSPAQLASEYTEATGVSVSHTAIIKHFRKLGVPRDLRAKVQAKADAMVMQAMVTGNVSSETVARDTEVIEKSALDVAKIRISHRADITRARALALQLLGEIEAVTGNLAEFQELGEILRSEDDRAQDKRNDLYRKVIDSAGRVDTLKKLSETLKNLIGLEREAYGLDIGQNNPANQGGPEKDFFTDAEIAARAARILAGRARGSGSPDPAGGQDKSG